jgi:DHA1 family multidrug resistance protein-like MFS transporter
LLALTLGVVMLGFGVVIPVYPFYIQSMGASGKELGLLIAISPALQLVFSPIWGIVSDRVGRKPVLMVGILGYGLSMFLFGLATELWMLYVLRALGAVLSAATLPTTYAYISDSTTEEDRSGAMGVLGAATGLGMMLGPAVGGWLGTVSLSAPFFITAAFCLLTLVMIALFLPESLPAEARAAVSKEDRRLVRPRELWHAMLGPLGVLFFLTALVSFALSNFQGIFGLYALQVFGFGTQEVGWIMTAVAVVAALGQGLLTGPLTKRFGDVSVMRVCLLLSAVSFGLILLANDFWTFLLTISFFILPNALLRVTVVSLTSQRAEMGQGAAMGLSNSFTSLGRIVGPIWAGYSYDVDAAYPFWSGVVAMLVGFVVSLVWVRPEQQQEALPSPYPHSRGHSP